MMRGSRPDDRPPIPSCRDRGGREEGWGPCACPRCHMIRPGLVTPTNLHPTRTGTRPPHPPSPPPVPTGRGRNHYRVWLLKIIIHQNGMHPNFGEHQFMDRQEAIEFLIDHYENPRNRGPLEHADVSLTGGNPGCADVITMEARFDKDGKIEEVHWD